MYKKLLVLVLTIVATPLAQADVVKLIGSESVQAYLQDKLGRIENATGHTLEIQGVGSSKGYQAANEGLLGMASRPPKASEQSDNLSVIEIGIEALVIGVNFTNKIQSLEAQQISDIFSGKVTSWTTISPDFNYDIKLYGPETYHGTFGFFAKAFQIEEDTLAKNATLSRTHRKTMRYLSVAQGNMGFFTFGSWKAQQLSYSSYVNLVKVNGVAPTNETVSTGTYPLIQPLYFATNRPLTKAEQEVVDYLLTL